jgi:hypothetical protein
LKWSFRNIYFGTLTRATASSAYGICMHDEYSDEYEIPI